MKSSDAFQRPDISASRAPLPLNCGRLSPLTGGRRGRRRAVVISGRRSANAASYIRVKKLQTTAGTCRVDSQPQLLRIRNMGVGIDASGGTVIDYTASMLLPYQ